MINMHILRLEAIAWCSFIKLGMLSENDRGACIEGALCELEEAVDSEAEKIKYARAYIEHSFAGYQNKYLEYFIKQNTGITIYVEGPAPALFTCKCCGYKTLTDEGEYDICKVCFWEDDGLTDEGKHSSPNHMTLGEAKRNFVLYGASTESSLPFLDSDRFLQFSK